MYLVIMLHGTSTSQSSSPNGNQYYSRNTQRIPLIIRERPPLIGDGLHYWNQDSTFKLNIVMLQR